MFHRNKHQIADAKTGPVKLEHKDCKMSNHNEPDLFRQYIHDIRNMKKLDKEMMNNIRNMSNEDKMDIINAFNDIVETLKVLFD